MRRIVFILFFILLALAVGAGVMLMARNTAAPTTLLSATATSVDCMLLDVHGTPDLRAAIAVDALYQQMPMFTTPVAVVATQDKPFEGGCIPASE